MHRKNISKTGETSMVIRIHTHENVYFSWMFHVMENKL